MATIAFSTGSLHTYGISRAFEIAAEAGFEAVEVLIDHRWDSRQSAYLRRLSRKSELPIVAVHSPFVPHVPGWPSDPLGRLRHSAALARDLEAEIVVAHLPLRIHAAKVEFFGLSKRPILLPVPLPVSSDYRHFLLNGLAQFEADEGVLVGMENMPAKRVLGKHVDIHSLNTLDMLTHLPHLTLDTTHLATWQLDPMEVYQRFRTRIVHIHLSNYDGEEHKLPETGHLPLAVFLQQLKEYGYQGAVSVELRPDVLQAENEEQVRAHLRSVVAFCREHLGRV